MGFTRGTAKDEGVPIRISCFVGFQSPPRKTPIVIARGTNSFLAWEGSLNRFNCIAVTVDVNGNELKVALAFPGKHWACMVEWRLRV